MDSSSMKYAALFFLMSFIPIILVAQKKANSNEVYIDAKGILRHQHSGQEASYFGVNYTIPFAYGYRSHLRLKINIEKAIDQDVYHMARLGINAFRVHVWDTEISDSAGNLKNNEHLRLFDYLLSKLEERHIRIIITPIAFWGNGYPDEDQKTNSFVEKYGKNGAVIGEAAFLAQETYLQQFFEHVNPYTRKRYTDDQYVIAAEVNNEPHHTGSKETATRYINRMIAAIKSTGWTKPVFYNISESPDYADAVACSNADGFSFQWYPTGLVAGHAQQGNLLPLVDRYVIPFDSIPAFHNKPKMIYEFESADVLQPYMYPAMARSFKSAGFQWATQFAYDPLGTAYANTEYQTHYLNLAYTPAKAISLMIAAQVFKYVPLNKAYGSFPADTAFGPFKLSYQLQSSEMNTDTAFYYANSSTSKPRMLKALKHIAGVGSSPIVQYKGTGAYFLDRVGDGAWRLEVMPDAVVIRDPFGKNDLDHAVTKTISLQHAMKILLPDLGSAFSVKSLDVGNTFLPDVLGFSVHIKPGTYLLQRSGRSKLAVIEQKVGEIGLHEFVAPPETSGFVPTARIDSGDYTKIVSQKLSLYRPGKDMELLNVYSPSWNTDPYVLKKDSLGVSLLNLKHKPNSAAAMGGIQVFVKDKMFKQATDGFDEISISSRVNRDLPITITLIDEDANAFSAEVILLKNIAEQRISLADFKASDFVLLPRPYPSFQPLRFQSQKQGLLKLNRLERIQLMLKGAASNLYAVDIYDISLTKHGVK
jgi:hypothetical protein